VVYPPDRARPLDFFGADAERARQVYDADGTLLTDKLASLIAEDITMHELARFVARQMAAEGTPAWLYRFDYIASTMWPPPCGQR
jgi:para-nitrobenzyl esterase